MNEEMIDAMRRQRELFVEKFGREPGPDAPVFFDPDAEEPQPMQEPDWDEIFAALDAAGIDRAIGEAWRELGYIVTEQNRHAFSAQQVRRSARQSSGTWTRAPSVWSSPPRVSQVRPASRRRCPESTEGSCGGDR